MHPRKSGSQLTPRWREMDSNPRSPVGDSIFSRPPVQVSRGPLPRERSSIPAKGRGRTGARYMGFVRLQRASAKRGLSGRSDADAGDRCGPIFDGAAELTRENDEIGRRRFASPSAAQLLETIAQTFALEELDEVNSPPAATRRSSGSSRECGWARFAGSRPLFARSS